mmetsp:Transcript_2850/g.8700  ORF Transcript_2850/g.8700 Transcript_2850/m.8700 type:complete len:299 (-) Transcript_2850:749-1645(-)
MTRANLLIDGVEVWSGAEAALYDGALADRPRFLTLSSRNECWLFKHNYMSSWRDVNAYTALDEALGLKAGPSVKQAVLCREDDNRANDIMLERPVELLPVAGSWVDRELMVKPLWEGGPLSASVHAAVTGTENVIWRRSEAGSEANVARLVKLLDPLSFQRCAIAHLVTLRCTNLADILLRTSADQPDSVALVLGDLKKCFWPSAASDLFWSRFPQLFAQLAEDPLCRELHALMASWTAVQLPDKLPLRETIRERIQGLAIGAVRNGPGSLSVRLLGDLVTTLSKNRGGGGDETVYAG